MADVNFAVEAISASKAPLRLTDAELQTLSDGARQVPPQARSAFLHAVAGLLPADHGPDAVDVAVRTVLAALAARARQAS